MKRSVSAVVLTTMLASCMARPSVAPAPKGARGELVAAIDSMVNARQFRNAHWGVLIVDPLAGDTLYSHNAAKLFIPASNEKLVTTSVMLTQLGPDFRYHTTLGALGSIADGTLNGDLGVVGRGDPTVSDHMDGDAMTPLRAIADSLRQHGITRITGGVVAVGDAFPGPVAGAAWPWDGLDGSSFAGVDELLFNEGLSALHVKAGARVGDTASVATSPSKTYPVVRVIALTVAPDSGMPRTGRGRGRGRGGPRVTAYHDTLTSTVIVRGAIALGDSATIMLPQHDPDAAYTAALTEALRDGGISVGTRAVASIDGNGNGAALAQAGAPHLDSLFSVTSVPLRDILPFILKPSQNQIAEAFLRTIGLERTGVGTADSGRKVVERQFADWNLPSDGYVIRDGSGLSRSDLVSPEVIIGILDNMRRSPNFDLFYQSLPIAGVDGTIRTRMQNTAAQGNLHAKTGTLGMVRSLSGYVRTASGRLLEFSILCNNWTVPQADVDKVADDIGVRLANLK